MPYCQHCGGEGAKQLQQAKEQLSLAKAQVEQVNTRLNQVSAENRQLIQQMSEVNKRIDQNDSRVNERVDFIYQAAGYIIGIGLVATGFGWVAIELFQSVSRAGG